MSDIGRLSDGCLTDIWWVSDGCLSGVWLGSGRCLEGIWDVSGRVCGHSVEGAWSEDRSSQDRTQFSGPKNHLDQKCF